MRLLLALPLLLAAAQAAVSPEDISVTLYSFRDDAVSIKNTAAQINIVNGPLVTIDQGPLAKVVKSLNDAADSGNAVGAQLGGTAVVTDKTDADNIFSAYVAFAQAHVALFDQMTSRSGVMRVVPNRTGPSVTKALKRVQAVIYGFTDFLEQVVPSKANAMETQFAPLVTSMDKTMRAYSPFL
ncbi:hypothetical protein P8C59_005803 [Phyllachora maydis]|uniref:Uncharacterized protein n=1 Tax=Phyllachora maydis TaxID=1825666 RepID=A0AAD9I524_9PEZI|nr:hypothetical protein P8C59_005803 [Phyllachora maydis]